MALAALCLTSQVDFIIEHPEDLGQRSGELPANIWQLLETRSLAAHTWAVYQCEFRASSPKPTRFISSLLATATQPCNGWPLFDRWRNYLGPLPSNCGHRRHAQRLIGKKKGHWVTAASAAYPPGLCAYLARIIASQKGTTTRSHQRCEQQKRQLDKMMGMRRSMDMI